MIRRSKAVDEEAPGADLARVPEEQTVRLLKLLLEASTCGDDPDPAAPLELGQIPPEQGRLAHDAVGRHLEQDDEAGLVVIVRTPVDELDAECRLARPGGAFDEDQVPAWNPARQDRIEALDPGSGQVEIRHWLPSGDGARSSPSPKRWRRSVRTDAP